MAFSRKDSPGRTDYIIHRDYCQISPQFKNYYEFQDGARGTLSRSPSKSSAQVARPQSQPCPQVKHFVLLDGHLRERESWQEGTQEDFQATGGSRQKAEGQEGNYFARKKAIPGIGSGLLTKKQK